MKRGALIGFGKVAEFTHAPVWRARRDARIVAVVETRPERREAAARALGVPALESLDRVVDADFAVICTPPAAHAAAIQGCLARGWDVLCEKPLVTTGRDAGLVALARAASNKKVHTVHNWLHAPPIARLRARVAAGEVGEPGLLVWLTERPGSDRGAVKGQEDWRTRRAAAGGGILFDHGWHACALTHAILGDSARRVGVARMRGRPMETTAAIDVEFADRWARIELTWEGAKRSNEVLVHGTKGTLWLQDDRIGRETFREALSATSIHPDWLGPVIDGFLQGPDNFESAVTCLKWILAAYAGGRTLAARPP